MAALLISLGSCTQGAGLSSGRVAVEADSSCSATPGSVPPDSVTADAAIDTGAGAPRGRASASLRAKRYRGARSSVVLPVRTINAVLATVQGKPITQHDMSIVLRLRAGMASYGVSEQDVPQVMGFGPRQVPPFSSLPAQDQQTLLQQAVDTLIQDHVINRFKIRVEPSEVQDSIRQKEQEAGLAKGSFLAHMAKWEVPASIVRQEFARQAAWVAYIRAMMGTVSVTPSQIQEMTQKIERHQKSDQFLISEIEILENSNNSEPARAKVNAVKQALQEGGQPFGEIAQRWSDAPSGKQEGGMIWKDLARTDPQLAAQLKKLTPQSLPALLQPVRLATASPEVFRWVFWLVLDHKAPKPGQMPSQEEIKTLVLQDLLMRRAHRELKRWRGRIPYRIQGVDGGAVTGG